MAIIKTVDRKSVKFDLYKTILLIQQESKLRSFFVDEYGDDFETHFEDIRKGTFDKQATEYVKLMFKEIIKADDNYVEQYERIDEAPIKTIEEVLAPATTEPPVPVKQVEPSTNPTPPKKYTTIKRRLPKSAILTMAKERGHMTENERALIAGFELKNVVVRIHNKGKQNLFTDEEARTVIATVETVMKKLGPILKKKTP